MKINTNVDCQTADFWDDLENGYIVLEEVLLEPKDVKRTKNALKVLLDFRTSCEDQIEDFYI